MKVFGAVPPPACVHLSLSPASARGAVAEPRRLVRAFLRKDCPGSSARLQHELLSGKAWRSSTTCLSTCSAPQCVAVRFH